MSYAITNKAGRRLSAFHSNGGWSIRDVFPCSFANWFSFKTEKEAEDYLKYMTKDAEKQKKRWGDWADIALKFIKTLKVTNLE